MNRFDNALAIQGGACNPSAIALSIVDACREFRGNPENAGEITHDPAIRLMVHQLAYLCKIAEIDTSFTLYGKLGDYCRENSTKELVK